MAVHRQNVMVVCQKLRQDEEIMAPTPRAKFDIIPGQTESSP
jgi:hypothetical protein